MYVILTRSGYTFAADGPDYVVVFEGNVVFRSMNKAKAEAEFMRRSRI